MKKILVCFWGQDKESEYLKNNPFMDSEYYEDKKINLGDLCENIKDIFNEYQIDFLWSTWTRCNIEKYENIFKYILKSDEPEDFESFLNEINYPYVGQIRHDERYHKVRHGYYTQFFHKHRILSFLKEKNFTEYDGIIFSRTDIFFKPKKEVFFNFDNRIIFVPEIYWGSRGIGINDHILIGNYSYVLEGINFNKLEDLNQMIFDSHNIEQVNQKIINNNNRVFVEFGCEKYCRFPLHMS